MTDHHEWRFVNTQLSEYVKDDLRDLFDSRIPDSRFTEREWVVEIETNHTNQTSVNRKGTAIIVLSMIEKYPEDGGLHSHRTFSTNAGTVNYTLESGSVSSEDPVIDDVSFSLDEDAIEEFKAVYTSRKLLRTLVKDACADARIIGIADGIITESAYDYTDVNRDVLSAQIGRALAEHGDDATVDDAKTPYVSQIDVWAYNEFGVTADGFKTEQKLANDILNDLEGDALLVEFDTEKTR